MFHFYNTIKTFSFVWNSNFACNRSFWSFALNCLAYSISTHSAFCNFTILIGFSLLRYGIIFCYTLSKGLRGHLKGHFPRSFKLNSYFPFTFLHIRTRWFAATGKKQRDTAIKIRKSLRYILSSCFLFKKF